MSPQAQQNLRNRIRSRRVLTVMAIFFVPLLAGFIGLMAWIVAMQIHLGYKHRYDQCDQPLAGWLLASGLAQVIAFASMWCVNSRQVMIN
jgi:hypothetical protein